MVFKGLPLSRPQLADSSCRSWVPPFLLPPPPLQGRRGEGDTSLPLPLRGDGARLPTPVPCPPFLPCWPTLLPPPAHLPALGGYEKDIWGEKCECSETSRNCLSQTVASLAEHLPAGITRALYWLVRMHDLVLFVVLRCLAALKNAPRWPKGTADRKHMLEPETHE